MQFGVALGYPPIFLFAAAMAGASMALLITLYLTRAEPNNTANVLSRQHFREMSLHGDGGDRSVHREMPGGHNESTSGYQSGHGTLCRVGSQLRLGR
jgi:hypothetical protein